MSTTNANEPDRHAAAEHCDLAEQWQRKGDFWVVPAMILAAPHVILLPLQFAVDDSFWSGVILAAAGACLAVQYSAIARMGSCYRRARKILDGGAQ